MPCQTWCMENTRRGHQDICVTGSESTILDGDRDCWTCCMSRLHCQISCRVLVYVRLYDPIMERCWFK